MPLEFIHMNSHPVVAVNCDNRKAVGNEQWHRTSFGKSTKNDNIKFRKKKIDKIEIKAEINKELECK